jgi:hypothetical protein
MIIFKSAVIGTEQPVVNISFGDFEIGTTYTHYYDKKTMFLGACEIVKFDTYFSVTFIYWDDENSISEKSMTKTFSYTLDLVEKLKGIDDMGKLDHSFRSIVNTYQSAAECNVIQLIELVEICIYTDRLTHIKTFIYKGDEKKC